jgi:uncharacterized protein YecE (DUF72 family)
MGQMNIECETRIGDDMASSVSLKDRKDLPVHLLYGERHLQLERMAAHVEEFREWLVPHVRAWSRHNVYFGASSWDSPGWIGTLYKRLYKNYGEFVQRSLEEYVEFFDTVCMNTGSYHLPQASTMVRMKQQMPPSFGVTVEVANEVMMYRFPHGHPDATKRGTANNHFLDADLLAEKVFPVIGLLEPHVRAVLLQIAPIYLTDHFSFGTFLSKLDHCLGTLPCEYRYAVEIQNPEYLHQEYFACLHEHNVAHVLNQGVFGSSILDHVQIPGVLTADFAVLRSLSGSNLMYEPLSLHRELRRTDYELRLGVIVRRCIDEKKKLYVYLTDRAEGCAPLSIAALMNMLNPELAKLSPLKSKAA